MKQVYVKNRDDWRKWLSQHHDRESGIWLIFYKKESDQPTLEYEEAVEEALCFGWIDSIIKKLDEEKYARKFTPRKEQSYWSPSNKKRVSKMIKQGRMTEAGLVKINAAKKSGMWDKPDRPDISFEPPEEFKAALEKNSKAKAFFEQLAPSYRKHYIVWIQVAKRPETRENRVKESISLLERGKKLGLK